MADNTYPVYGAFQSAQLQRAVIDHRKDLSESLELEEDFHCCEDIFVYLIQMISFSLVCMQL